MRHSNLGCAVDYPRIGFWQLRQKRSVTPLKEAEVLFVWQGVNEVPRCVPRLVVLLFLICTAVLLNAHANSDTQRQQNRLAGAGEPGCNVSILAISDTDTAARGADMKATCVKYAYPRPAPPGGVPNRNSKTSTDGVQQIVGYALPVTIAPRTGPLSSLSVTNPSDRIVHLKADVKEWYQDAFGQDVFVASSAAFISPTRVVLEPGVTRQFSVKLPEAGERELAFRILLQQLPGETYSYAGDSSSRITQSIPAFSEPAQPQNAKLRARRIDAQHLLITNDGDRRARLIAISSRGQVVAAHLVSFALAHSNVLVPLDYPISGISVDIETDQGRHLIELR